jgi:hypothetical protein
MVVTNLGAPTEVFDTLFGGKFKPQKRGADRAHSGREGCFVMKGCVKGRLMAAQDARCTNQTARGFTFTGGNRRPRRMTKTVCIAAISPKLDQIDAIHIQRSACERVGLISIETSYSTTLVAKL